MSGFGLTQDQLYMIATYVACAAVVLFAIGVGQIIEWSRPKSPPVIIPVRTQAAFAWRWCPDGCGKVLTADSLRPCPVCGKAMSTADVTHEEKAA
jgi:hypothetical protein